MRNRSWPFCTVSPRRARISTTRPEASVTTGTVRAMSGFTVPVTTSCDARLVLRCRGERILLGMLHREEGHVHAGNHVRARRRFLCGGVVASSATSQRLDIAISRVAYFVKRLYFACSPHIPTDLFAIEIAVARAKTGYTPSVRAGRQASMAVAIAF